MFSIERSSDREIESLLAKADQAFVNHFILEEATKLLKIFATKGDRQTEIYQVSLRR